MVYPPVMAYPPVTAYLPRDGVPAPQICYQSCRWWLGWPLANGRGLAVGQWAWAGQHSGRQGGSGKMKSPVAWAAGAIQWISAVNCLNPFRSCPLPTPLPIALPVAQ